MSKATGSIELEVELNKTDVEVLDQEAALLGCTRNDLICQAVDRYLDRIGELFKERKQRRQEQEDASRTEHRAKEPPTAD